MGARCNTASVMPMGSVTSQIDHVALEQASLTGSFAAVSVHHLLKFFWRVEQKAPRVIGVWHRRCHVVIISKLLLLSQKRSAGATYWKTVQALQHCIGFKGVNPGSHRCCFLRCSLLPSTLRLLALLHKLRLPAILRPQTSRKNSL